VDEVEVRPFPVIIHIDKSHSDLFGNLAVAPIQVMPAMINLDGQQKVSSWRQVATIPNLSAGKGKDGKKSKDALLKLKDYHKVMSVALSSFRKCYEDGGFMWKDKTTGKHVLLKPYVQHFVGDIAGVNEMIGHYNTCFANCVTGHYLFGSGFFGFWVLEKKNFPEPCATRFFKINKARRIK
jgi:hypothetical protein